MQQLSGRIHAYQVQSPGFAPQRMEEKHVLVLCNALQAQGQCFLVKYINILAATYDFS